MICQNVPFDSWNVRFQMEPFPKLTSRLVHNPPSFVDIAGKEMRRKAENEREGTSIECKEQML